MSPQEKKPGWGTSVTRVAPNSLLISGYPLEELIEGSTLLETAHLLVDGELPSAKQLEEHLATAATAVALSAPPVVRFKGEPISQVLAKQLMNDADLAAIDEKAEGGRVRKTVFALGRFVRYLADNLGNAAALDAVGKGAPFSHAIFATVTGEGDADPARARMIEAMIVASVDHGVTPPSAQATIIASSVRGTYETAVAAGIGAITDVHGGAGAMAAEFFLACARMAREEDLEIEIATHKMVSGYVAEKKRIKGLGHRVHTEDPRRNVLWKLAD